MDDPDTVMTDGCVFNHPGREGFFQRQPVALALPQEVTDVDIVNGCCMMISAELFRKIGLIDERFFLVHEESDFCLRAREAGFRCGVIGEAMVWHKGSSSFQRTGKRVQRYYDSRNLYLLLDKHADEQRQGRGRIASMTAYLRYVYHRWSIEQENGNADAADAVVEGLYDAMSGRFGPMQNRGRWGFRPGAADCSKTCTDCDRGDPTDMRLLFVKERLAWPRSSGHDVHCYHLMQALGGRGTTCRWRRCASRTSRPAKAQDWLRCTRSPREATMNSCR